MARTKQQQPESNPSLSIKAVTKSSVWDIQENDVFRMWEAATKDAEVKENVTHYLDIFKSAFFIEDIKEDVMLVKKSYEKRGYKVAQIKFDESMKFSWAIKKKPIMRVTDLTYENIRHISAAKLIEFRWRLGFIVTVDSGHHPQRFRHLHHYPSQGPSAQEGRYV